MRNYQKIIQNAQGQLLAWYETEDHTGDRQTDFDVLEDYAVYPHETGAFIAEYLPTLYAFGSYATLEEALEAVLNKINDKKKLQDTLEEAGAKFDEVVKTNSLDERYKDVQPVKKVLTNEELKKKYRPYENFNSNLEKFRNARMKVSAKLNADYYDRLLWS